MATKKKKVVKTVTETNAPNIQFVGRRKLSSENFEELDAPSFVNSGQNKIELPSSAEQKAGFYLPPKAAAKLRAEYPFWYKEPKLKDGKALPAYPVSAEQKAVAKPKRKAAPKPKMSAADDVKSVE